MTSMWDIFQSSGLVDSATQSWRERERAERAAGVEAERKREKRKKKEGEQTEMQAHTTYNVFIYISVHACVCVGDEWADFPCFFLFCSPLSQTHTRQDKAKGGAGHG